MTRLLVTSASGANGDGYGAVLGFTAEGTLTGPFSADHRITDPRGPSLGPSGELVYLNSGDDRVLALDRHGNVVLDSGRMDGLDPDGGHSGPTAATTSVCDGAGRSWPCQLVSTAKESPLLPDGIVPFPRGFGFAPGGEVYLASGVGPSGEGENTIAVFGQGGALRTPRLVNDPELSPLDLTVAPNGTSWSPASGPTHPATRRPVSGIRPFHGAARPHVVSFAFSTGSFTGMVARLERLNGQALVLA